MSAQRGPLTGMRVVELGSTVAGPFCARLMADFGADVIKLEQPGGDAVRSMGTQHEGESLYGASIFRNKKMACVDLRTERGRDIARRLCEKADIVVENFRPGTMERFGLGYDALSAVNPGLVLVRISGFGQDGPYSQRGGYGVVGEAVSGLRGINGDPDRPPPRAATSLADYIAGLYAAFGAMMALVERDRTGLGQVVDSSLYEGSFSFMEPHVPAYGQAGVVAKRAGPRLPGNTPNSIYATADHGYVVIAAASDSVFRRLCQAIGREELPDDPKFHTGLARNQHAAELDDIIGRWTSQHSREEVEQAMSAVGVPASRIFSIADIFKDPHFHAREMLLGVPDPALGEVTLAGVVPKLSSTPGSVWRAGPRLGVDTRAVLAGELGLSEADIAALAGDGVVVLADEPNNSEAAKA